MYESHYLTKNHVNVLLAILSSLYHETIFLIPVICILILSVGVHLFIVIGLYFLF